TEKSPERSSSVTGRMTSMRSGARSLVPAPVASSSHSTASLMCVSFAGVKSPEGRKDTCFEPSGGGSGAKGKRAHSGPHTLRTHARTGQGRRRGEGADSRHGGQGAPPAREELDLLPHRSAASARKVLLRKGGRHEL